VRELARQCLGQVRWADLALAFAVALPLLVAELVFGEQRWRMTYDTKMPLLCAEK
jgi:hypothetical protein